MKFKNILLLLPLFLLLWLSACLREEFTISSTISSVSSTESDIVFYETTVCNKEIEVKAVLRQENEVVEEIDGLALNVTTKYCFENLKASAEYVLYIEYRYDTEDFIEIAQEKITTKEASVRDIEIYCEDLTVEYNGLPQNPSASASVEGLELEYAYYQNGTKVNEAVNVGEYTVRVSFSGNESYNPSATEINLIITPQPVDIDFEDFTVSYGEAYSVEPDLPVDYTVSYWQEGQALEAKPAMPGSYTALIRIEDKNYTGEKEIRFTICKLQYTLNYVDTFVFYGDSIEFELDDFVEMRVYKDNLPVAEIKEIGEYTVEFFFQNHLYYDDFEYSIQVKVDYKKTINITAEDCIAEENSAYEIAFSNTYDLPLAISYFKNQQEIEKPTESGIYQVRLSYPEDETYYASSKEITLVLYPHEQDIAEISSGLYHIRGQIVAKDKEYSYAVNGDKVLFVRDLALEIGKAYRLIGEYQGSLAVPYATVLYTEEIESVSASARQVSLIGYEKNKDDYLFRYIRLNGMVIYENAQYYLKLEEDYAILLDGNYSSYWETKLPMYIEIIPYDDTFVMVSSATAVLTQKEELYATVLLYEFPDIEDTLPLQTDEPYEIEMRYTSSSNLNVIQPSTMKVNRMEEDVYVLISVEFYTGEYTLSKTYTVKVLKITDSELKIYSIEMHQQYGDSTLITYGDFDILIDAGDQKDGAYVNSFLKEHISEDNHLDMLIVTHCHSDHMGGLAKISSSDSTTKALDGIASIGMIIDYGHDRSTNYLHNSWVSIRNSYIQKGAEYYPVYNCAKNLDGASSHYQIDNNVFIDFIDTQTYATPEQNLSADLNIYSIAALLSYKNFKFFFAGDLEDKGESNLLKNIANTPLNSITEENLVLYKAAHHGTDPGNNNGGTNGGNQLPFLKAIRPDYFYISAAMCKGSSTFIGGQPHPYPKCLANFLKFSDNIYYNGTNGTLEIITDGTEIQSIHGYAATTGYLVDGITIDYASQADLKLTETLWYEKYRQESVNTYYNSLS